jgi:hypothetical protein
MDLSNTVLEFSSFDILYNLAVPENSFQSDGLPLLECLGEPGEIPPGIDAVPFGAVLVISFVALPAFLGCDVEDDVFILVLSGFGFSVLSESADEEMRMILLNMMFGSVSFGLSAVCGTCLPNGCAVPTHSLGDWKESAEGDPDLLWGQESAPRRGAQRNLARRACVRRAGVL